MKKVLFLLVALIFSLTLTASAAAEKERSFSERLADTQSLEGKPKIALFVNVDPSGISDPVKSAELIYNNLTDELHKTRKVQVVPEYAETNKVLRRYIRENTSADSAREKDFGFIPKKQDLINLAQEVDADYVLFLNARISNMQQKFNMWTGFRAKNTLLFEIIIVDEAATRYLVDEAFTETGSAQGSSFDRAFNKALTNILEKIDLSKLDF